MEVTSTPSRGNVYAHHKQLHGPLQGPVLAYARMPTVASIAMHAIGPHPLHIPPCAKEARSIRRFPHDVGFDEQQQQRRQV